MKKDLITRLNEGPIMCAEGYLFAMERRGYLSAGPFAVSYTHLTLPTICSV